MISRLFGLTLFLCAHSQASAANFAGKAVPYSLGTLNFEGYQVSGGSKGSIRVVHDWMGLTDKNKTKADAIAALGYCFGGTGVLELARSGADIKAVVSFHGGLDSPTPADGKNIKARVLALHGADDPVVPVDQLSAFEQEMRTHKIDWQLIKYGRAVHSFTDPTAGNDPKKGAAYNPVADARSWLAMQNFLNESFSSVK